MHVEDRLQSRPAHVGIDDHDARACLGKTDRRVDRGRSLPFTRQTRGDRATTSVRGRRSRATPTCAGVDKLPRVANGHRRSSTVRNGRGRFPFCFCSAVVPGRTRRRAALPTEGITASAGRCKYALDFFSRVHCVVEIFEEQANRGQRPIDRKNAAMTVRVRFGPTGLSGVSA